MQRDEFTVEGIAVEHFAPASSGTARPPLLLVHGTAHGAWCWENWTRTLAAGGWESYALSLRNHPPSRAEEPRRFRETLRVADYAEDVAVVARHIGRPAVVVGHSLGGIVAQAFVQAHLRGGGRVAGLVLVASVPPAPFGPLRADPMPTDRPLEFTPEQVRSLYLYDVEPAVFRWICEHLAPASPSVMNEYSLGPGLEIDPGAFNFPKLVLTAAEDRTVVPRDSRLADFYGADYVHLTEIGHDMMLDRRWPQACRAVEDWLARHFAAPVGA